MKKLLLSGFAAVSLSACATAIPGLETFYSSSGSSWPAFYVEQPELAGQEGTATLGDFLFTQKTRAAIQARIEEDATVYMIKRDGTRGEAITVSKDNPLAIVTGFGGRVDAFCNYSPSLDRRSNRLDMRVLRVCLLDTDEDSRFDRPVLAAVAGQGTGGALAPAQSLPTMLQGHPEIDIPFTTDRENTSLFVRVGPMIERGFGGNYFLSFAVEYKGDPISLDQAGSYASRKDASKTKSRDAYEIHFAPEDLPITVTTAGAEVTILSIEDKTVRYRIEKPYDPKIPVLLGYAAEPVLYKEE